MLNTIQTTETICDDICQNLDDLAKAMRAIKAINDEFNIPISQLIQGRKQSTGGV